MDPYDLRRFLDFYPTYYLRRLSNTNIMLQYFMTIKHGRPLTNVDGW